MFFYRLRSHCIIDSDVYKKICSICKDFYESGSTNSFLLAHIVDLCEEMTQSNISNDFFNIPFALEVRKI